MNLNRGKYRIKMQELAELKKTSMRKLSEELFMDEQTMYYWNNGKAMPHIETLLWVCDVMGVQIQDMIGLSIDKPRTNYNAPKRQGPMTVQQALKL